MTTYSSNLALTLMADGEDTSTWGDVTNVNLGTLIEQAISGYVTQAITDGADTTITIPNGATGVARNMFLELTGTLTAARNLIVPANKKLYFIYNHTVGGFPVTVKVSGQTGVSIYNLAKAILVCNGTDIFNAASNANLPGLQLPTVTKTSGYLIGLADYMIRCDCTSAGFTVTLPDATTVIGRIYCIKKVDTTTNQLTIATTASQTIDGNVPPNIVTPYESLTIQSNGTNWDFV